MSYSKHEPHLNQTPDSCSSFFASSDSYITNVTTA